jgi:hypothetical protein
MEFLVVVPDGNCVSREELIAGLRIGQAHLYPPSSVGHPEVQRTDPIGKSWAEHQSVFVYAQPPEAFHQGNPSSREGGHVETVAGVVLQVRQVHQGCFSDVVMRKVDVTGLGGDDRL